MAKKAKKKSVKKKSISKNKKVSVKKVSKKPSKWKAVPLKGSFMVMAILGFLLSYHYIYSQSFSFGIAAMIVFAAMFVASIVSMTKAPLVKPKEK